MKKAGSWIAVVLVVVSAALIAGYEYSQRDHVPPGPFASLSQRHRNLAVYDEVVRLLHANYFDRATIDTPEWQERFAEFRKQAAAAPDSKSLYSDVFLQLAEKFPHSHVEMMEPSVVPPAGKPADSNAEPARETRLPTIGFDLARLRRGGGNGWAVGDVQAGLVADRQGIEPGWGILNLSVQPKGDSCVVKAIFLRLTAELVIKRERGETVDLPTSESAPDQAAAQKALEENREYDCGTAAEPKPFELRQLAEGVTYLRFDNFKDPAVVEQALTAIDGAGAAGLVVDLRRNIGGYVDLAQIVLGRLLGPDQYIGTFRHGKKDLNAIDFRTRDDARQYSGPLALIIGPLTQSGAEIAAAAVIDNRRGSVVGRWTAGSVLKARMHPLPDGGYCNIPFEDFVRSGGRRIEGVGVAPDVMVIPTLAEIRAGRDVALEQAVLAVKR